MSTPRVLFIGLVWPELTSSAASQNILSYVSLFAGAGYHICFASAADKSPQSTPLKSLVHSEQQIALNCSSFNSFIADFKPDVVVFDRFVSEEQFGWRVSQEAPGCLKILDCEDLHFLRDARHRAHKKNIDAYDSEDLPAFLYSDLCKRELASILRCDLSILLSDTEIELLTQTFGVPAQLLHHCRFLLPNLQSSMQNLPNKSFSERKGFISIGNFRHAPNWDAVLTIKNKLWRNIKEAIPEAECHIYGAYLPPKAKQLENKKEGFFVHGYAEDAHAVIRDARVLIAPLHFGAGIKGKLVDAMQCSTPSITSPIGAEGLLTLGSKAAEEWPGVISPIFNNGEEFAKQAIALYSDEQIWTQASRQARCQLDNLFDYEQQSSELMTLIATLADKLEAHRQRHFIGQVIQHNTLASTKYMSQWIEAKNR